MFNPFILILKVNSFIALKRTKNILSNQLTILLLLLFVSSVSAQEICNNGIDDDGDGLVDCYDSDCDGDCDGFYYGGIDPTCNVTYVYNPEFGLTRVWKATAMVNGNIPLTVGDVDNDGVPEVIAARKNANIVSVINGQTGVVENTVPASLHNYSQGLALIDANNNGEKELFFVNINGILYGYQANGIGITNYQNISVGYNVNNAVWNPQFADFDQDGVPELYLGNQIYETYTGKKLCEAGSSASRGTADGDLSSTLKEHSNTIAADVLPDNFCSACSGVELVCGNEVYSVQNNGGNWVMNLESSIASKGNYKDGKVSIADWDGNGQLDVIVSSVKNSTDASIYIWNPIDTTLISNSADGGSLASNPFNPNSLVATSISSSRLGVMMVADVDGDGYPEMGGSGADGIFMLDHDLSELWSRTVNNGLGVNSMTSFDFEGDGTVEVIYQTLDSVLILDGKTGVTIANYACSSLADGRLQMPVVADVTADGQANIICACGNSSTPSYSEVHVLNSVTNDWKPTRQFWNQFSITPTGVTDDLKILAETQNPLTIAGHNSFLVQVPFLATNGDQLWLTENCDSVRLIVAEDGVNNDWLPDYGNVTAGTCEGENNQNSLLLEYPSTSEEVEFRAYSATGVGDLTSLDFSIQTVDFNKMVRVQVIDTAGVIMIDTVFDVTTQNETLSADLSAFENSPNLIKTIKMTAQDNAALCVESIKFTKGAGDVSTREVFIDDLKIITNEQGVEITSAKELKSINIYTSTGSLVQSISVDGKIKQVPTHSLSKGVYLMKVEYKDVLQVSHVKVALK